MVWVKGSVSDKFAISVLLMVVAAVRKGDSMFEESSGLKDCYSVGKLQVSGV